MPVVPLVRPPAAPAANLHRSDGRDGAGYDVDDLVTKCGRCRLSFVRHPSIDLDSSARWWLCPSCRLRLLGDASTGVRAGTSR